MAEICKGYSLLPKEIRPFFDPSASKHKAKRIYMIDHKVQLAESTPLDEIDDDDWVLCFDLVTSSTPTRSDENITANNITFNLILTKANRVDRHLGHNTVKFPDFDFSTAEFSADLLLGIKLGLSLVHSIATGLTDENLSKIEHRLAIEELTLAPTLQNKKVMSVVMGHLFTLCYNRIGPMRTLTAAAHIATAMLLRASDAHLALIKKAFPPVDDTDPEDSDDSDAIDPNETAPWESQPLRAIVEYRKPKLPRYFAENIRLMLMPPPAVEPASTSTAKDTSPPAQLVSCIPPRRGEWSDEAVDYVLNTAFKK